MTVRVPIRTIYTNGTPTGLGEFQSGDAVGYAHGGTGLTSIGTAGQVLSVNDSANGFTFATTTSYGDSDARSAISVTDAGGDGSLAYNSSTGVLTYTGPSASEVRAHFSAGTGVSISSGTISTDDTAIVHDNLSGFVADEHVAHTGVTLTAGAGLTGGGDISASRSFAVGAGTGVTVNADDIAIGQDVATSADVTFNTVTTTAGLTVGGNLTVNGTTTTVNSTTLDVADKNITIADGAADAAAANGAGITVDGASATLTYTSADDKWNFNKGLTATNFSGKYLGADSDINAHLSGGTGITYSDGAISTNDAQIVHDSLSGFVANEHIDHSGVTLTAGDGLTGGGTIASSRTFAVGAGTLIDVTADAVNVDLSELTTSTTDGDGDYFVVVDTSNNQRKLTKANINISGFNNNSGYITGNQTITLSGDVTGSGTTSISTTIAANAVGADELNVSGNGTNGQALLSDGDGTFSWGAAGASITNDNTTNTTQYLAMSRSTSGSLTASYVAGSKLTFNPSTGILNSVDFNATSDESLKTNIETIQNAASKVSQLRGVNFNWKDNDRYAMGVIAQEVEKVIPEVVNEEDGTKSVSYGAIVGLLIEAVKDLQNQVDELKK